MTGAAADQRATIPAHIDGADLVISVDDFATLAGGAYAEQSKKALEAVAGDFRVVFTSTDPTHLRLTIEGTSAPNGERHSSSTLTKVAP